MIIEKHIPPPLPVSPITAAADAMQLGESVFCETENQCMALTEALRYRGRVSARKREGSGFRVWRIARKQSNYGPRTNRT